MNNHTRKKIFFAIFAMKNFLQIPEHMKALRDTN
jgi:hypothetical protein